MARHVQCPSCGKTFEAPEADGHASITCPLCKRIFETAVAAASSGADDNSGASAIWHLFVDGAQRLGPFSEGMVIERIRQGRVDSDDLVWCQGMRTKRSAKRWARRTSAIQVKALSSL